MKITLDVPTLISLAGILAMLSGFVYTTTLRLNNIEAAVEELDEKLDRKLRKKDRKKVR